MSNSFPTLATIVSGQLGLADIEVSNLSIAAPFAATLLAESSSNGKVHQYSREIGSPTVGFRAENAGLDYSRSNNELVTIALKYMDCKNGVDVATADGYPSSKGGAQAALAKEANAKLRAGFFAYEQQLIYGVTAGAAAGFEGMADVINDTADLMCVDATGSTANTGSSVWAVRVGIDDFCGVYNGEKPFEMGEHVITNMVDGSGKSYLAYVAKAGTWLAAQIASKYSFGRICNLTADSGKGLTDALLSKLMAKFPAGRGPTVFVMNRRSLQQLQQSRTATNATGTEAPFPDSAFGVPIIVTDSIVSTEALLTATPVAENSVS